MTGIYIHIPFCVRRCLYCDFFSTTQLNRAAEYTEAVVREIRLRYDETGEPIRTIYIGGGTPSTMDCSYIERILQTIGVEGKDEITMEINPGDATKQYLYELRKIGIQRLSIGIQSFQDELLVKIGRRHNAQQAITAVRLAQEAGFDNISIDLMYALPTQTMYMWQFDIDTAVSLGVQHISSYGLMYEDGTAITQMRNRKQIEPVDEETENIMYDYLCERLEQAGFVHYEVSNFAKPSFEAVHNSNYWNHSPYIGIGAGAHSLVGNVRSWNPENLDEYIHGIMAHDLQRESESLTKYDLYNERVMLGLRTNKGVSETLLNQFRSNTDTILDFINRGMLCRTDNQRIIATQKGLHLLNQIIEKLMIDA